MSSFSRKISEYRIGESVRFFDIPSTLPRVAYCVGSILLPVPGDALPAVALARNLAATLLAEGTRFHSKEAIDAYLDNRGAKITFSADGRQLRFEIVSLSEDLADVLSLAIEMIRFPAFTAKAFAAAKARTATVLERALDDTEDRAFTELSRLLYPANHRSAYYRSEEFMRALRTLTRSHVAAFWRSRIGYADIVLSATGSYPKKKLHDVAKKGFTFWKHQSLPKEKLPPKPFENGVMVKRIPVSGKTSADLFMGLAIPITSHHADMAALRVVTAALGSGFTSRLFREVREKRGLTYHAYAALEGVSHDTPGFWYVGGSFAPQVLKRGADALQREVIRLVRGGLTDREVAETKRRLIGLDRVSLSAPTALARMVVSVIRDRRELPYLDTWERDMQSVTRADTRRVTKQYLDPKKLRVAIAGEIVGKKEK